MCDDTRGVSGAGSTFHYFNIYCILLSCGGVFILQRGFFLSVFNCNYEHESLCLFNRNKLYLLMKKKIKYLICFLVLQLKSESMKQWFNMCKISFSGNKLKIKNCEKLIISSSFMNSIIDSLVITDVRNCIASKSLL